jgi:acyl-CoA synthetase (NDP forming)
MSSTGSNDLLRNAFLSPGTIALVGASADTTKNNSRPQRFLEKHGYPGRVLPINPGRKEIFGVQAYPDLRSAPGPIDHALIMVPAAAVPDVVDQCCELKIPVATIFSAGFAELGGEGLARQQRMVAAARKAGLRLLGPNSIGLVNVQGRVPLCANAILAQEPLVSGGLSVVSQSGSTLGTLLSRAQGRGLGFSKLVSVGNESDLGVGEIAGLLVDDPDTHAILLFLETFRDADRLAEAARRAYAAGKPIVAYKLGRSDVGRKAAASHTGAMVGTDEVSNAFFRAHGIFRVEMLETLFELPQLVKGYKPSKGKRAAILTGTGGAAAMVGDRLGVLGVDVVAPPPKMLKELQDQGMPIADGPITDIPMGKSDQGAYTTILSTLLASDHCDAVVGVIGSTAQTNLDVVASRILKAGPKIKPLAVFLAPRADAGLALLQENGVAGFRTPESCADAVSAYLSWREPAPIERDVPPSLKKAVALTAGRTGGLNEYDAGEVLSALGISVAERHVWKPGVSLPALTGMWAIKILSADILHKSDHGLVRLGVDAADVVTAAQSLYDDAKREVPDAMLDGVLVQRMTTGLTEVIVGYRRDPEVGPVIVLGAGGIAAELKCSISVRVAPVTLDEATSMIDEVRELGVLKGFRRLPKGDIAALAATVRALSLLALPGGERIREAEINPLLVREEGAGVAALDALIMCE